MGKMSIPDGVDPKIFQTIRDIGPTTGPAIESMVEALGDDKFRNANSSLCEFIRKIRRNEGFKAYQTAQNSWYCTVGRVEKYFDDEIKATPYPQAKQFFKKMFEMFPDSKDSFFRHLAYDLWHTSQIKTSNYESVTLLDHFFKNAKEENPRLFEAYRQYSLNSGPNAKKVRSRLAKIRAGRAKREVQQLTGVAAKKIRAAKKPSGGAKWAGKQIGEEGVEGLGKAWRAVRKFGQEVFEFVIKRAH